MNLSPEIPLGESKVNEPTLPSVPESLYQDESKFSEFYTDTSIMFPSTVDRVVIEKGNSSPHFIRSSMQTLPSSEQALGASGLPLTLMISPFSEKTSIEIISKPERCPVCRSTPNAFTVNTSNRNFLCNICDSQMQLINALSSDYSTVEYIEESNVKNISVYQSPILTFIFDTNMGPFLLFSLDILLSIIESEEFTAINPKVAFILMADFFITFRKSSTGEISFIKILSPALSKLSHESIIDSTDKEAVINIIDSIKDYIKGYMSKPLINPVNTLLRSIGEFSKSLIANKVVVFSNVTSSNINYENYLEENRNITFNLFTTSQIESAGDDSFRKIVYYSYGKIYRYGGNRLDDVYVDLLNLCYTKSAYNVKIHLRGSDGLIKSDIIAPGIDLSFSAIKLNSMTPHSAIQYNLGISNILHKMQYIQAEVSYVDFTGISKVRIFNLKFDYSTNFLSTANVDTTFASMIKMGVDGDYNIGLATIDILRYYKKKSKPMQGKLILPEALKALPVLIQSVTKNINSNLIFDLPGATVESIIKTYYPCLFSLSDYFLSKRIIGIRLSKENLKEGEIYILENGKEIYFYITKNVDEQLLTCIFNQDLINTEGSISLGMEIFNSNTEEGNLCINLINDILSHYDYYLHLRIVNYKSIDEVNMLSYMVEDSINGYPKYFEYLCQLYKKVKLE